jgi:hypothetical protein
VSEGWRLRARRVIRETIAANPDLLPEKQGGEVKPMIKALDAAYPFGERRYTPYKEWLDERAKAIDALATKPVHRICRVCGAKPNRPCKDLETGKVLAELHQWRLGQGGPNGPLFGEA